MKSINWDLSIYACIYVYIYIHTYIYIYICIYIYIRFYTHICIYIYTYAVLLVHIRNRKDLYINCCPDANPFVNLFMYTSIEYVHLPIMYTQKKWPVSFFLCIHHLHQFTCVGSWRKWVMSHTRRHVTHTTSCHICTRHVTFSHAISAYVMSHMKTSRQISIRLSHMNESCHFWMRHVTCVCVMSHRHTSRHLWIHHITYKCVCHI